MDQEIPFNEKIGALEQRFDRSHGALFHFTCPKIADSISQNKELHITRADCLLDEKEINYGMGILNIQAGQILSDDEMKRFVKILDILESRFEKCFILSLSKTSNSDKHKKDYGKGLIEFKSSFPYEFSATSYHSIETGDGFTLSHATDIYKTIKGNVLYDYPIQSELANEIIKTFKEINTVPTHTVDQLRFADILLNFIMLCKEKSYEWEEEYRVGLIANEKWSQVFENTKANEKYSELDENTQAKNKFFIKLKIQTEMKLIKNVES